MQINQHDGLPFDPAARGDWLAAIDCVLEKSD
jgi:hypothetical protein